MPHHNRPAARWYEYSALAYTASMPFLLQGLSYDLPWLALPGYLLAFAGMGLFIRALVRAYHQGSQP